METRRGRRFCRFFEDKRLETETSAEPARFSFGDISLTMDDYKNSNIPHDEESDKSDDEVKWLTNHPNRTGCIFCPGCLAVLWKGGIFAI